MAWMRPLLALPLALAAISLAGCSADTTDGGVVTPEEAARTLDVGPGGAADSAGLLTDTALGQVHEGHVEQFPDGQELTTENLRGRMDVYRFEVEAGQSFALVLAATDGALDPQLMLRDPENYQLANSKVQGLLPMLAESDAIAVHTAQIAGPYFAFASGNELHSAGDYRLHLIELPENAKALLGVTNPSIRIPAAELREHEAALRDLIARGGVVERADGYVEETSRDAFDGTLREWAQLVSLVNAVNELRGYLFEGFLEASDLPPDDVELLALVGRTCALIWAEVMGTVLPSGASAP